MAAVAAKAAPRNPQSMVLLAPHLLLACVRQRVRTRVGGATLAGATLAVHACMYKCITTRDAAWCRNPAPSSFAAMLSAMLAVLFSASVSSSVAHSRAPTG